MTFYVYFCMYQGSWLSSRIATAHGHDRFIRRQSRTSHWCVQSNALEWMIITLNAHSKQPNSTDDNHFEWTVKVFDGKQNCFNLQDKNFVIYIFIYYFKYQIDLLIFSCDVLIKNWHYFIESSIWNNPTYPKLLHISLERNLVFLPAISFKFVSFFDDLIFKKHFVNNYCK